MNPYRVASYTPREPVNYDPLVCIGAGLWLRRSWIHQVLRDGTVIRTDGNREKGDPARLRDEGLL